MSIETVVTKKYGVVRVIRRVPSNRGGLALIRTTECATAFWVRAYRVGPRLYV